MDANHDRIIDAPGPRTADLGTPGRWDDRFGGVNDPSEGRAPHRVERAVMLQQWRSLASIHWRYEPGEVQRALPEGLEVDTFDGAAWVGLLPFRMVGIAAPVTPPIPYFGTFPETNVRTYVVGPDGPGIWFHSLDITRLVPVLVARATYRLPYMWAAMAIDERPHIVQYEMRRRRPRAEVRSQVSLEIGETLERPSPLDHFLSARWRLYATFGSRLTAARVEHEPWPLRRARLARIDDQLVTAAGYSPPTGDPHVLFSPGVAVRIERPRFVAG
jgi:uncharacterized protein YqjF (DUF2071 family)